MGWLALFILRHAPYWVQDWAVGVYNTRLYALRRGGRYWELRRYFAQWEYESDDRLSDESGRRLCEFLNQATSESSWYRNFAGKGLSSFPLLDKKDLVRNLDLIATIGERHGVVSLTGGTTGASMKVLYRREDLEERNALLDHFRSAYGYELGEKVAWFSGKNIATQDDVDKGRCYRDDRRNKIRFFSTFLINGSNFESYWNALEEFQPRFIVGFPSSVLEIAMLARERGLAASWKVEVMFPTAETVLPVHREVIGQVFGCKLVDQYASSEGAPFVLECPAGRLHIHPLSGVFEVLDQSGAVAQEGEMVVTSFSTRGTPLIRYRIGDRMRMANSYEQCDCDWNFPMVDWIDGRTSDFIYSRETGRVNLGNLSNCTKDIKGIFSFQVQQDAIEEIIVRVVGGENFDRGQEKMFEQALRARVGEGMRIQILRVHEIPREKSGKFRIVKNSIAGQIK